jgi:hypothetical protein
MYVQFARCMSFVATMQGVIMSVDSGESNEAE